MVLLGYLKVFQAQKSLIKGPEIKHLVWYPRPISWKWFHRSHECAVRAMIWNFRLCSNQLHSAQWENSFVHWLKYSKLFFCFSKVVAALVALRESGDLSKEEKLNSSIPPSDIGKWTRTKRCVLIWSSLFYLFWILYWWNCKFENLWFSWESRPSVWSAIGDTYARVSYHVMCHVWHHS